MEYQGSVYRPPSEARSLILQVTIGCSHNRCTFCYMYKDESFRIRKVKDVLQDIDSIPRERKNIYKRIFLADGDALVMKTDQLLEIVDYCYSSFENLERIGIYASPKSVLIKSDEELELLYQRGIDIAYLGVETGSEKILSDVNKGVGKNEMKEAGIRLKKAGFDLSVMILIGLGGVEDSDEHIRETACILNDIDPDYLSFLTLMIEEGTPLYDKVSKGAFTPVSPYQGLVEVRKIISKLDLTNAIVRSNHVSNYVDVRGTLPQDKVKMVEDLDIVLSDRDGFEYMAKDREYFRRL